MVQALVDAAADTGIGLTLLPVLYERAGFAEPALRPDQARFHLDAQGVWAACEYVQAQRHARLRAGVALHSLRAVRPESVHRLAALARHLDGPIHIHVAEQTAEVDDCLAHTGQRPVQWLAAQRLLDARWQLVHATHVMPEEIAAVGRAGSGAVICPSTEGNLGDGLTDVAAWLGSGASLAIGSDSHVTRSWREELRWLEYGQRLQRRQRNVCAAPPAQPNTAARLWQAALDGGARAAGHARWGLQPGARADLVVVDPQDSALAGLPPERTLDALVFSSPARPWHDVMVAGQWVIQRRQHPRAEVTAAAFAGVMHDLWG
jgi:formimidoylglutamate deiminase